MRSILWKVAQRVAVAFALSIAPLAIREALAEEVSIPLDIKVGDEITIQMKSSGSQTSTSGAQDRTQTWVWRARVAEHSEGGGVWSFQLVESASTVAHFRLINQLLQGRVLTCVINWQGDCEKFQGWGAVQSELLAKLAALPDSTEKIAVQALVRNANETTAPRILIRNYSTATSVQGRRWIIPAETFTETVPSALAGGEPISQTTTLTVQPSAAASTTRVGFNVVQDSASLSASYGKSLGVLLDGMALDQMLKDLAIEALKNVRAEAWSKSTAEIDDLTGLAVRLNVESGLVLEVPAPLKDKSMQRVDTVEVTQTLVRN